MIVSNGKTTKLNVVCKEMFAQEDCTLKNTFLTRLNLLNLALYIHFLENQAAVLIC